MRGAKEAASTVQGGRGPGRPELFLAFLVYIRMLWISHMTRGHAALESARLHMPAHPFGQEAESISEEVCEASRGCTDYNSWENSVDSSLTGFFPPTAFGRYSIVF